MKAEDGQRDEQGDAKRLTRRHGRLSAIRDPWFVGLARARHIARTRDMDPFTVGVDNPVMTTRMLVLAAILVAGLELMAQTSTQRTAPAGVLVGIHTLGGSTFAAGPPVPDSLRTVWLDTDRSATPALPRLLVPRSSGFWWLGLNSACSEERREGLDDGVTQIEIEIHDALWSSPIDASPIPSAHDAEWNCRSDNVFCENDFRTGIDWVWPDFISISKSGEYGCGAHSDGDHRPEVHRLDDLESPLTVGAVFGPSVEARLRREYERAKREYRSRHREDGCDDPVGFSPTAWHVERQGGRWLLEGWADTHRLCEVGVDYAADVDVSRITGTRPTQRLLPSSLSGVKDAIPSADGRWILLIREHDVALSPREAPDKTIARAPLTTGDSVVMAEWAQGRNIARWRDQVRKLAEP